jgi:type II secretory pathway pseudopilin PulG
MIQRHHSVSIKPLKRARIEAYTLVEVLVVLFIMVLLASIALPTVKDMLANQQVAKATRNITAFMNRVRSRAISEGRSYGVRIERFGADTAFARSHSVRIRELVSIPPYSGDSSAARVKLTSGKAEFDPVNAGSSGELQGAHSSLINLSWSLLQQNGNPTNRPVPIQPGDCLELPGGRLVAINGIQQYSVTFNINLDRQSNFAFPDAQSLSSAAQAEVPYKIHRRPIPSAAAPYSLPRGVAIDLNYSGMQSTSPHYLVSTNSGQVPQEAPDGSLIQDRRHFAPKLIDDPDSSIEPFYASNPIDIIFGPQGQVESITVSGKTSTAFADGMIFLCIGDTDGVRPDSLLSQENGAIANVLNPESKWVVINPTSGRITSAPFASTLQEISSLSALEEKDFETQETSPEAYVLNAVISDARQLVVNYSDTEDLE